MGDKRESAGGFGVTSRWGWSWGAELSQSHCHRVTVTQLRGHGGSAARAFSPTRMSASVLPFHSQQRCSKSQESPKNPTLLLRDSFLFFLFASAFSLPYFGSRQSNRIILRIQGSSVLIN